MLTALDNGAKRETFKSNAEKKSLKRKSKKPSKKPKKQLTISTKTTTIKKKKESSRQGTPPVSSLSPLLPVPSDGS
jgi:hypothetical protein